MPINLSVVRILKIIKLSHFAMGSVGSALLGLFVVPISAWAFSPSDIGKLTLVQSTIPVILNFILLGLDQAYVREFHQSEQPKKLFTNAMFPAHVLLLLLILPVAIYPDQISMFLFGEDNLFLVWATYTGLLLSLLIREWALVARMQEKAITYSISQMIPKLLMILGIFLTLILTNNSDFLVLFGIYISAQLVTSVFLGIKISASLPRMFTYRPNPEAILNLLKFGIPTMIASVLYLSLLSLGNYSLRFFSTFTEIGIYGVAISVGGIAAVLQGVFSTVWSPIIFKASAEGNDKTLLPRVESGIVLAFGIVSSVIGLTSWLLPFFLPKDYSSVTYLAVGACAVPLIYMVKEVTSIGLSIRRKMNFMIVSSSISLLLGILINLLLTPRFGAAGAITSIVVSMWILFVMNTESAARVWHDYPRTKTHLTVFLSVVVTLITIWSGVISSQIYLIAWGIYFFWVLLSNKKLISIYSRRIKQGLFGPS